MHRQRHAEEGFRTQVPIHKCMISPKSLTNHRPVRFDCSGVGLYQNEVRWGFRRYYFTSIHLRPSIQILKP